MTSGTSQSPTTAPRSSSCWRCSTRQPRCVLACQRQVPACMVLGWMHMAPMPPDQQPQPLIRPGNPHLGQTQPQQTAVDSREQHACPTPLFTPGAPHISRALCLLHHLPAAVDPGGTGRPAGPGGGGRHHQRGHTGSRAAQAGQRPRARQDPPNQHHQRLQACHARGALLVGVGVWVCVGLQACHAGGAMSVCGGLVVGGCGAVLGL